MFTLLEIARIYKALKRFADLQGPGSLQGSVMKIPKIKG